MTDAYTDAHPDRRGEYRGETKADAQSTFTNCESLDQKGAGKTIEPPPEAPPEPPKRTEIVAPVRAPLLLGNRGIELRTMDDLARFAMAVAKSGLAPRNMDTPEKVMIAIQLGMELGISPMASVQNIAVINSRPSLWGDIMLALCRASGLFEVSVFREWLEGDEGDDNWTGHCVVQRKGSPKPHEETFSVKDAKRAGLWAKQGTWQTYPQRMLIWRSRGFALRHEFGDVLLGLPMAEEVLDYSEPFDASKVRPELKDRMEAAMTPIGDA